MQRLDAIVLQVRTEVLNGGGLHALPPSQRFPGSSLSQPQNISAFVSSLTTPTSYSASAVESPPTWVSGDDNQLPSSRPVLRRLCICVKCICAWQTRPFRPPGLTRERERKPAISITGKQTGDTHSKPAISIAGIGDGRRSSADKLLKSSDSAARARVGRKRWGAEHWGSGHSRLEPVGRCYGNQRYFCSP
jgi:hypothetical protein